MTRIAGQENTVVLLEALSEPLTDTICTPPERVCEVHGIRLKDASCLVLEVCELDVLWLRAGGELDVEADEMATFAGDDEQVAGGRVNGAFTADVWESGEWVDVHDAPDGVGGVA